jgi:hypothetical protein
MLEVDIQICHQQEQSLAYLAIRCSLSVETCNYRLNYMLLLYTSTQLMDCNITDGYSVWVAEVGIKRLNRLLSCSLDTASSQILWSDSG